MRRGFTLIELATTIGVLTVISVLTVLVINPSELFKQARDAQRVSDLKQITDALEFAALAGLTLGTPNSVYVSIPQVGGVCPGIIPTLQPGHTYVCAPDSSYQNTDGTGWIPVNFNQSIAESKTPFFMKVARAASPFVRLPIDPTNELSTSFYAYIPSGRKYQLVARFESAKYSDKMYIDEGRDPDFYEVGPLANAWATATGADSLIAYWPFEDGQGLIISDVSGNDNDATTVNSQQWVTGQVDLAGLGFNGTSDYAPIKNSAIFNLGTAPFSVSVWAMKGQNGVFGGVISDVDSYGDFGWSLFTGLDNKYGFSTMQLSAISAESDVSITDSLWHHIVGVRNGDRNYIYIDSVLSGTGYTGFPARNVNNSVAGTFGAYTSEHLPSNKFFKGVIDDARIYNKALSLDEIKNLYLLGGGINKPISPI